jgi:peroxiredoxin
LGYSVFPDSVMVQVMKDSLVTADFILTQKKGSIFVNSVPPGGYIILDHIFCGKTSPDTVFDISLGDHTVSVQKSGYRPSPESLIVTVFEDQTSLAEFTLLDTLFGSLSVSSNITGDTIVVDNKTTDKTTPYVFFNYEGNLSVGTHVVTVFQEGYSNDAPAKKVIDVVTGDTILVAFNLSPASVGPDTEGQLAPDFELLDDSSHTIKLYNYRGSVVIVNFWATSCVFCMLELPFLQELYNEYSTDSLMIFAVNYGDGLATIQGVKGDESLSLTYHLLVGKGSQMLENYNLMRDGIRIKDTPITIIIDRSGLIYRWVQGFDSSAKTKMRQALYDLFEHD